MDNKEQALLELAKKRQLGMTGFKNIGFYHDGAYECDYVSPYSKSAHNHDSEILFFLQDWSSDKILSGELDEDGRDFGYTKDIVTNINLKNLIKDTFNLELEDVYITNLFPFIRPEEMSYSEAAEAIPEATQKFAIPMIEIINPKIVVCLSKTTYNALRVEADLEPLNTMTACIKHPFTVGDIVVFGQAHPGHFGRLNRIQSTDNEKAVEQDWCKMRDYL